MDSIPETANKGLEGVVACTSEISTIHDVTLLYRGYTIEDLTANCSFEEVIHLLWEKSLPTKAQLKNMRQKLGREMKFDARLKPLLKYLATSKSHSMSKLRTLYSAWGCLDSKAEDISELSVKSQALKSAAVMPALVASLSRAERKMSLPKPKPNQSIAWNFLHMITGKKPGAEEVKLFDAALVLHADHELNASTFTARVIASTTSDYYSAISGALASLKGPLHGGANEQVIAMLKAIGQRNRVQAFIDDAIENKKKVMGIGHRVYKNGDPRAKILKEMSKGICERSGLSDEHAMLVEIEKQMDEKKGLMPNVDFYSGLVYKALGIRPRDFTPIFAVSRIVGWSAQILEQYSNNRIYRPRAVYTGPVGLKVS